MKLEWTFAAESYLDQLSREDRVKVLRAVEGLPQAWEAGRDMAAGSARMHRLTGEQKDLYVVRAGADLRLLVRCQGDVLSVLDVVRRSQLEGLRRVARGARAASG